MIFNLVVEVNSPEEFVKVNEFSSLSINVVLIANMG